MTQSRQGVGVWWAYGGRVVGVCCLRTARYRSGLGCPAGNVGRSVGGRHDSTALELGRSRWMQNRAGETTIATNGGDATVDRGNERMAS